MYCRRKFRTGEYPAKEKLNLCLNSRLKTKEASAGGAIPADDIYKAYLLICEKCRAQEPAGCVHYPHVNSPTGLGFNSDLIV